MRCGNSWTGLVNQLLKLSIAKIAENKPRRLQRIIRKLSLYFGINRASDDGQIGPAIVIEIGEAGAPADVPGFHPETRSQSHIGESGSPIVAVEHVGVIREVSFEDVEFPVEIVIA